MTQITKVGPRRIVVIGGGLAGLSFLHYVRTFANAFDKNKLIDKIVLVEAQDYLGGSIKSKIHDDGVVHDLGPKSIRTLGPRSPSTMVLAEHLGLDKDAIYIMKNSPSAMKRQIYTKSNELIYLNSSFLAKPFSIIPGTNTRPIQAFIRDRFRAPKMDLSKFVEEDPPLYDFFAHRFGEDLSDNLLDPVMRGINAGDCRLLSTRALFPDLLDHDQQYGSVIKGLYSKVQKKAKLDDFYHEDTSNSNMIAHTREKGGMSYSFKTGLQSLPNRLSNSLLNENEGHKISIYNQTKAISIRFNEAHENNNCSVVVETIDGHRVRIDADHIVSCIPSVDFIKLADGSIPGSYQSTWDGIRDIPHCPVGSVCVEFRNRKLHELPNLQSFGFLTHSKSNSKVLGIVYDSIGFPDSNPEVFKLTAMIGGHWFKEILGVESIDQVRPEQLEDIALNEIRAILGINDEPKRITTQLWKTGIAQYTPGHSKRIDRTREEIARLKLPLTLLGQSYDGVAINDVVFRSRMEANKFVTSL